jgi:hypothetical protein
LISAILEELDVPFWYHRILRNRAEHMLKHMPVETAPQGKRGDT